MYIFESKGFVKETPFGFHFGENQWVVMSFVNHSQGTLFDVHLPIINNVLDAIKDKTENTISFFPVRYRELLNSRHPILAINEAVNPGKLQSIIWPFAIWLKPLRNKEGSLTVEKKKMFEGLVHSAARGDVDGMKIQFDIINDLYSIYYETK